MKYWSTILFFILSTISFGQKEVSNWYFGAAALDFNCNPPNPIAQSLNFYPQEGCSSISDTSGNLLFYSDGHTVFDKTHQVMLNGFDIGLDTFCVGSSTQGVLIVKQPLQDSIYYIFTTDCAENKLMNGFCYSIVNMNSNNGNGAVVLKKQQLINKTCEKLAAVRHANGVDLWVLTHEWGNANFFAFLLTSSGLNMLPNVSYTGRTQLPIDMTENFPSIYPECASKGHLKFSPQGNKLVVLSMSDCHSNESHAELFSFNSSNGSVNHNFDIYSSDTNVYYGASFSPDGNLLYLSSGWYGRYIHQFNLTSYDSSSVAASKYIVYSDTNFTAYTGYPSALQIGPNGKMYNATNIHYLNVIDNPNIYGAGCNFLLKSIPLSLDSCWFAASQHGLPNNDESYYLNAFVGSVCNSSSIVDFVTNELCINAPTLFSDISNIYPFSINNWKWDFGDPTSVALNYSSLKNPQHTYSNTGLYQVKLTIYSDTFNLCKVDSITKTININCVTNLNKESNFENNIVLFPIPTSNTLQLKYIAPITCIEIYNGQSKLVFSKTDKDINKINLNLSDGIYFVVLHADMKVIHKKIVINNSP